MQTKSKITALLLAFIFLLPAAAATVEFPANIQPGTAKSSSGSNEWSLYNDILSASFKIEGGKLYFNGSPELTLAGGSEPFEIVTGSGTTVKASEMTLAESPVITTLTGNPNAVKDSEKYNGKALQAKYTYGNLTILWKALLRDGSHYLITELEISASANTPMKSISPMIYKLSETSGEVSVVGNTRGAPLVSEKIFAGLETPLGINSTSSSTSEFSLNSWKPESWGSINNIPSGITSLGFTAAQIAGASGKVKITGSGNTSFTFSYASGTHRMNLIGVDLCDADGKVVASDYHIGYSGSAQNNNTYTINIPAAGQYTLRYFGETKTETITSSGNISISGASLAVEAGEKMLNGKWSRNTTLKAGDIWKVSSVVGLVAKGQKRRSLLAYSERERAVPWRSLIHYNSWYELNIDRNNSSNPLDKMTEEKCLPVLAAWKKQMFEPYNLSIDAFVWDDGWDEFNSLWDFHIGFPNGFSKLNQLAAEQGAGIGTWLGPVGGYGDAKAKRLAYWNRTHPGNHITNFELSNPEYFNAFVGRCSQMTKDYDMRYFKFDGISDIGNATGPGNEEDAEGIINVLNKLRETREDLFFNCTVGTWASPFWFHYADAVWRQDQDWTTIGDQGNNREKWITYRDHMVYKNFTNLSPMCPINSLMTHGLIVSKYGPPASMPRDNSKETAKGIIREMRCAFGCGSGMIELYVDNDLMTNIGENGELWRELAECIKWHRDNKDVLADTHWVGGNPWDGSKANIYGWASWNKNKSTLTLRNPSASQKSFTTTLRQALEIPEFITGRIMLTDAFKNQTQYEGITGEAIDIDKEITFKMPAFDVVVLDGMTIAEKEISGKIKVSNTDGGRNANIKFKSESGANISTGWIQIGYIKLWNGKSTPTTEEIARNFTALGYTAKGTNLTALSSGGMLRETEYIWENQTVPTTAPIVALVGDKTSIKDARAIGVLKLHINGGEVLLENADNKTINFTASENTDHIIPKLGEIIEENGVKYLKLSSFTYPLGVENSQNDNNKINIYAAEGKIYVNGAEDNSIITITDTNGKTIKNENIGNNPYQTTIAHPGAYIINITNSIGKISRTQKVISR